MAPVNLGRVALGVGVVLIFAGFAALVANSGKPPIHRPLSEIDIQGHQAGTPANRCPGQYEYTLDNGMFLECWGKQ